MKRQSTRSALREIKGAGLTVPQVWEAYKHFESNISILPISLNLAAFKFLESKRVGNRRVAYIQGLRWELARLRKYFNPDILVGHIRTKELTRYLASFKETPKARIATMGRLSSFFSWCRKQGYTISNPIQGMDRPKLDETLPEILTLDQCRELVAWARRDSSNALVWITFCLFLGIRKSEFLRFHTFKYEHAHFQQTSLQVSGRISKTRKTRYVNIPPNVDHLWSIVDEALLFSSRYHMAQMSKRLPFRLPQNILRHTAASYMVARLQSVEKAALQLGNSAASLERYYHNPIDPSQVEAFYQIGINHD